MEDEVIPDDPVQHTIPKPANIMTPILETSVEEANYEPSLDSKNTNLNMSSSSSESDLSEFDSSDDQEDFEVWSTDNTSPDISENEVSKLESLKPAEVTHNLLFYLNSDPKKKYFRFQNQQPNIGDSSGKKKFNTLNLREFRISSISVSKKVILL